MYRLLKLRKLPSCKSQIVSFSGTCNFLTRTCSLCNHSFVLRPPQDVPALSPAYSTRMQSTNTETIMLALLKKKKRKPKKKYAELLEVTEDSSSQKKASVSKLTSKHLSLLAEQPDIDLNKLFQLKKLKTHPSDKSESKFNPSEALVFIPPDMDAESVRTIVLNSRLPNSYPDLNLSERNTDHLSFLPEEENVNSSPNQSVALCESVNVSSNIDPSKPNVLSASEEIAKELNIPINDPDLQSQLLEELRDLPDDSVSTLKGNMLEDHYEYHEYEADAVEVPEVKRKRNPQKTKKDSLKVLAAKNKRKEMEQMARSESLTRGLASFMDICVSIGLHNRALTTLSFYRSRSKNGAFQPKIADVKPYNILLQGFAGKANLTRIKEILKIMEEDEMQWSIQTYAAAFECVGRLQRSSNNVMLLESWISSLESAGWSVNDVLVKSLFVADQREAVLNAIRYVKPEFQPYYPDPDTCYSCELLQELNKRPKGKSFESPVKSVLSREELQAACREQWAIENSDHIKVKSIAKLEDPPESFQFYRDKLAETEAGWKEVLTQAFEREIEVLRARHKSFSNQTHLNLYPYLRVLDTKVYVDLLMKEIRRLAEGSETYSPTTSQLYRNLGSQVLAKYEIKYKRNLGVLGKIGKMYRKYCDWYVNPTGPASNTREQWQMLVHAESNGPSVEIEKKVWPGPVLASIGKFLYGFILRDVKIDINIVKPNSGSPHLLPAFYTLFRNHGRLIKEEIKPHPALARLFRNAALEDLVFDVNLVPMLSPPIPWTAASNGIGGYIMAQADLVRLPYLAVQQKKRMENCEPAQLYPSLDALNQLGSVPWVVNEPVLDVVIKVFNQGGSTRLDIPQPPSSCPQPTAVTADMSRGDRLKAFQERIMLRRRRAEMYSLWCDSLYRLSLANHYRKKVFWLPHNMDFRGRVYPLPPHLNHLGSDMARSLLQFAQGQPLSPNGLDWLMIHLINLTGLLKREPVEERLAYAKSILEDILDSADKPLTGAMWWATNEEPWQVLATCMEIARAIHSGNPETYVSRFPVHQDGSCNGLQHYAALGRDQAGAESVNLAPASHPQDVYSCVAALVERERAKDAVAGVRIAEILDGFVRRKVIKQTVMTTVYGVTRYGARLQIARQLKDIHEFPKEHVWHGSSYLAAKTFDSLREMFTSTKEIQDWFTDCARYIAQTCGENVEWITPLGLPVVQPYVRYSRRPDYQNKSQKLNEHFAMDMFERPNIMKQKNAFPPNFIHSLDSSHMMLTSLFCERKGITFVSVHDCYWTHPCNVDVLNEICREQFVALHSQPILEDLSQFLFEKFGYTGSSQEIPTAWNDLNKLLKQLPPTGNFDLSNVLKSIYFFS